MPLSYCYLLCCQLAYLSTSSIPWWLLSKKAEQSIFNLCGPDFLALGQMLICQRFGFQPVTLLSSICGCGPLNDSQFCLLGPSAYLRRDAPYLFHSMWCPGSSWMLTGPCLAWCWECDGFAVDVPPAQLCPMPMNTFRQTQAWFRGQGSPRMFPFGTLSWGGRNFSQMEADPDVPSDLWTKKWALACFIF